MCVYLYELSICSVWERERERESKKRVKTLHACIHIIIMVSMCTCTCICVSMCYVHVCKCMLYGMCIDKATFPRVRGKMRGFRVSVVRVSVCEWERNDVSIKYTDIVLCVLYPKTIKNIKIKL